MFHYFIEIQMLKSRRKKNLITPLLAAISYSSVFNLWGMTKVTIRPVLNGTVQLSTTLSRCPQEHFGDVKMSRFQKIVNSDS